MEQLNSIVRGKTVALVGPAAYMKNTSLGNDIEDHDIVIRINRSIETTLLYPEDVGRRTDILYSCLIETSMQAGKIDPDDLVKNHGVKLICCPPNSEFNGFSKSTNFHPMINLDSVNKIKKRIPIRIVDHIFHTELAKEVNCRPNTGFMAIYDLVRSEAKSITIYGFSFYLDGFIPGCKAGVEKEKGCTEKEFANMAFNSKRHIQKNMWKYAKETLPKIKNVKLDKTLSMILAMENLSKEEFSKSIKR